MGAGRFLREKNPSVRLHPLEPSNSPTMSTGYKVGKHRIQGISDEFIPPIVDLAKRHYEQDDFSVLPRNIANFKAFENAVALDVAMGGSTNTVLHILAAAQDSRKAQDVRDRLLKLLR